MSLFPAYAADTGEMVVERMVIEDAKVPRSRSASASPRQERALLASDSEEEATGPPEDTRPPKVTALPDKSLLATRAPSVCESADYYVDRRADCGNLRVSTLYYPGRPEYVCRKLASMKGKSVRKRRYWREAGAARMQEGGWEDRASSYRRALTDRPQDVALWMEYIDYRQCCGDGDKGALEAADEAVKAMPDDLAIRERQYLAARLALSPEEYVRRLQDGLQSEKDGVRRGDLWSRMIAGVSRAAGSGVGAVRAVAAKAASDQRTAPESYAPLLHAYGGFLRSAGLWEELVLLVELVAAVAFPPGPFPPPRDLTTEQAAEDQLLEYEQKTLRSGLPAGEVWARIERARAAVHWRAPSGAQSPGAVEADPQRQPSASEAAPLLRPLTSPRVGATALVTLLRLAEVPLMPCAEHVARAADPTLAAHEWESGAGPGLLALIRSARRSPPGRPSPSSAGRLLAIAPPRVLAAANGFGEWVDALWEAAIQWAGCERGRIALACWKLRWLHARALVSGGDQTLARKLRTAGRAVMMTAGLTNSMPVLAGLARLEGATVGPARGLHAAQQALRLALTDPAVPTVEVLYLARVVGELAEAALPAPLASAEAVRALSCAALRRGLPRPDDVSSTDSVKDTELRKLALRECSERCAALLEQSDQDSEGDIWAAMLPDCSEWFSCRVRLGGQGMLLCERGWGGDLSQRGHPAMSSRARLAEGEACALVAGRTRGLGASTAARAMAPMFPNNGYLANMSAGCPLWALGSVHELATRVRELAPPRCDTAALASALPALLRAAENDWSPGESERAYRSVARAVLGGAGLGGGSALWGALLTCGGACGRGGAALWPALAAAPHAHALYPRGATTYPPAALTLPDLMLERELRLHALPAELSALDTDTSVPNQ